MPTVLSVLALLIQNVPSYRVRAIVFALIWFLIRGIYLVFYTIIYSDCFFFSCFVIWWSCCYPVHPKFKVVKITLLGSCALVITEAIRVRIVRTDNRLDDADSTEWALLTWQNSYSKDSDLSVSKRSHYLTLIRMYFLFILSMKHCSINTTLGLTNKRSNKVLPTTIIDNYFVKNLTLSGW